MQKYHPQLELAPRDVVARAITRESMSHRLGVSLPVYLDMRHVRNVDLQRRFPGITAFLARHNLSLTTDLIPVHPAAHYLMGGVKTDLDGRAALPGLYAAGETACTGVHGANRLASNSLLEGLVFGARAGEAMRNAPADHEPDFSNPVADESQPSVVTISALDLRQRMWLGAGLLRDADGLREMRDWLAANRDSLPPPTTRANIELRNLHSVASLIVRSAIERQESRGAHFRTDFPSRDDAHFQKHSIIQGQQHHFVTSF